MFENADKGRQAEENYILESQIGFILRLASQRHTTIFQKLIPLGLTPTQYAALVKLIQLGQCSQNELGRQTAMDVATIKGVVDRLSRKGLVKNERDPNDKRRSLLTATDEAKSMTKQLHQAGTDITSLTLAPLSSSEKTSLLRIIKKMT